MSTARLRSGTVVCRPPGSGMPNDWLRFWKLKDEEVVFRPDGRVELPLQGYVRLRPQPDWAPDVASMAALFGLQPEDLVEQGDGWVLVPVPNAAMAVREGRVLLWCVDFVPRLHELEEMVLGTRYRQMHRFLEETERYRQKVGYRLGDEGELLYGGAVRGRVPLYHRVILPTRLLSPEEAMGIQLPAAPPVEWALPPWQRGLGMHMPPVGTPVEVAEEEEEEEEEVKEEELEEVLEEEWPPEAAAPLAQEGVGEPLGFEWPEEREAARTKPSSLRRMAGALVRAAASLTMRPDEPEEQGPELTDYLQVVGGVRTFLWALREEGVPARGMPAVWAQGQLFGGILELQQEMGEAPLRKAVADVGKKLKLGAISLRRVGPRLWQLNPLALPTVRPEAAAVRVALVPIGRREEPEEGVWVVLADLGSPGGLLLDAVSGLEERWLSWWTAAASLSLPDVVVWAEPGVPVTLPPQRLGSSEELVAALYEEVVARFEDMREREPLLVVTRLPSERDRDLLVTLAARGPEVGCYVVALGDASAAQFPAWVRAAEGQVEATVAGGRARLLPPEVEAPSADVRERRVEPPVVEAAAPVWEEAEEESPRQLAMTVEVDADADVRAEEQRALAEEEKASDAEAGAEAEVEEEGEVPARGTTRPPVAVRVLGPFSCSLDLRRQAAREVLSLLALRDGELAAEDAASFLEMGRAGLEVGRAYALKRLRNAMQDLRGACERAGVPKGVFFIRAGRVALVKDWVWCDLWEAEELLEAFRERGLSREEIVHLAGLVRGQVLEGEVFPWAEAEAQRVGRALWWKLAEGAERLLREERYEEACLLAEAARRMEPLEERPLRTQLRALAALGRRLQARQVARAYVRQMRQLLGDEEAEPEEETLSLMQALENEEAE